MLDFDLTRRDTLPEFPGLSKAVCEVLRAGKQDGMEHMIGLAPNGREIFRSQGDERSVAIPPPYNLIRGMLNGAMLVHNHPVGVGLSVPDLLVAQSNGASIIAVMPDGGWDYVGQVHTEDPDDAYDMTEAVHLSNELVKAIRRQGGSFADAVLAGNLLPVVAGYNLGVIRDWRHSYSDAFWERAEKFVPNIRLGSFALKGRGWL